MKVLGVTFDGLLTFSHHVKRTQAMVGQRNNILKKLAGTSWGCSKEVLLTTYKAVGYDMDECRYKEGISNIHQSFRAETEGTYTYTSRVWPAHPTPLPDISTEEKKFLRKTKTMLAQLRSGFSRMFNYMNSIDPNINDQCLDCGVTPHNMQHLFTCASNPTPHRCGTKTMTRFKVLHE